MGQKYEHYKGGLYELVGLAKDATSGPGEGIEYVAYRHLWPHEERLWVRTADEFFGSVEVDNPLTPGGKPIKVFRFREITDDEYLDLRGAQR